MKISQYILKLLKDLVLNYGFLLFVGTIYLVLIGSEVLSVSVLIQFFILASAYTFYKFAFMNQFDFGKKAQWINLMVCTSVADIMIIIWLYFFSPASIMDTDLLIIYIVVVVLAHVAVYAMLYHNGLVQAKQLNEKLTEYKLANEEQVVQVRIRPRQDIRTNEVNRTKTGAGYRYLTSYRLGI